MDPIAKQSTASVFHCISVLVTWLAAIASWATDINHAEAQEASPRLHALLVGCSRYDSIKPLNGPINDVALTCSTLSAPPYCIPRSRLKVLSSSMEADALPTRKNIIHELRGLSKNAQPGDQVFILLAGHGTRVTNDNPDDDWEPDGLDEVFLPMDASFKNAAGHGIRDDAIGDFLDDIRKKGAFVFLVVDSCFSGTISRGPVVDAMQIAARCVDGAQPESSANEIAALDLGQKRQQRFSQYKNDEQGGLAVLYAGPSGKETFEQILPPEKAFGGGVWHGRLTWKLNQVLNSALTRLTYRELEMRLRWEFASEKWMPMPWLSGTAPDREVLGVTDYPDRSRITLAKSQDNRLTINAGILHNMHEGAILEVTPIVGDSDRDTSQQRIKVTESHPLFSYVEQLESSDSTLSAPARCTLIERGIPKHRFAIAVAENKQTTRADNLQQRAFTAAVDKAVKNNPSLLKNTGTAAADLILFCGSGSYCLETPECLVSGQSALDLRSFGPFKLDSTEESQSFDLLERKLVNAARASLLRRLAITNEDNRKHGGFQANVTLYQQRQGQNDWSTMANFGETLHEGDNVSIQITNIDTRAFDVNMLYIDSAFRITSFFPSRQQIIQNTWNTRLEPHEKTPPVHFEITTDSTGIEDLLILLTTSTGGEGSHFLALEQRGIDDPLAHVSAERNLSNNTRLSPLLRELLLLNTDRRSIPLTDQREIAIQRLSWYVSPGVKKESQK